MTDSFDPYYKWLAIPPTEQPPNHYRLLGVPLFTSDLEVLENAADQRMAHIRSAQVGQRSVLSQRVLNELSAARGCLLDPDQKHLYDQQLRAQITPATQTEVIAVSPMPAVARRLEGRFDARNASRAVIVVSAAVAGLFIFFLIWRTVMYEAGPATAKTSGTTANIASPKKLPAQVNSATATKQTKPTTQLPEFPSVPNGLSKEFVDCTRQPHEFLMERAFDVGKDWLVAVETQIPSFEPGFHQFVMWGDDRGGLDPLCFFLQGDVLYGCVDDCHTNVRNNVGVKLSPEILGKWTKFTYVFRSQPSTLQLFVNGRLVAESPCKFLPNADRAMPIRVGGGGGDSQRYRGQLRSVVISNFP